MNSYPDYSYQHTDHPVGNRVAHLGIYSQCHWIHFGTPHDTGPLFTAEPNYGYSKIALSAQPNLHTSNTSLNAPDQAFDLQLTTSTQPTPPASTQAHPTTIPSRHASILRLHRNTPGHPSRSGISTHSSCTLSPQPHNSRICNIKLLKSLRSYCTLPQSLPSRALYHTWPR